MHGRKGGRFARRAAARPLWPLAPPSRALGDFKTLPPAAPEYPGRRRRRGVSAARGARAGRREEKKPQHNGMSPPSPPPPAPGSGVRPAPVLLFFCFWPSQLQAACSCEVYKLWLFMPRPAQRRRDPLLCCGRSEASEESRAEAEASEAGTGRGRLHPTPTPRAPQRTKPPRCGRPPGPGRSSNVGYPLLHHLQQSRLNDRAIAERRRQQHLVDHVDDPVLRQAVLERPGDDGRIVARAYHDAARDEGRAVGNGVV